MRNKRSATSLATLAPADPRQTLDRLHVGRRGRAHEHPCRPTHGSAATQNPGRKRDMPTMDEIKTWQDQEAHGRDGQKLGTIADIYLDRDTGEPEWAAIKTGLFGSKVSFAPLAEATHSGDGVQLPYTKDEIKDAPSAEADGELSEDEEDALYRHYGLSYSDEPSDSGLPTRHQATDRGPVGHDTSGPTTDDAMTRCEEEVRVGTTERETGRARLRKYVVTENVTQTVPVRREEVR